jgi:hypothetical protein
MINYLTLSDEEFSEIFNSILDEAELVLDETEQFLKIQGETVRWEKE